MKKIVLILFIFLFLLFSRAIKMYAADSECPCVSYHGDCVPAESFAGATQSCGAGYECNCDNSVGSYDPTTSLTTCTPGTCNLTPAQGNCKPGETQSWVVEDQTLCKSDADAVCHLSGSETTEHTTSITKYECCCCPQGVSCVSSIAPSITVLQPQECCLQIDLHFPEQPPSCTKENKGIETALGCFPTYPATIINWILKYSIMFAGGVGFLIMLWASFQIMTSSGDPEKLKAGQQLLGSAIIGILIIVFSLFILRFIGATILQIPGWK